MTTRSDPPTLRQRGSAALRRELSARNLDRVAAPDGEAVAGGAGLRYEQTYGTVPSVVYAADEGGRSHGNFVDASYRRILRDEAWHARLRKAYTGGRRIARRGDRGDRAELDCANSSDALLMNIFCYPRVLERPGLRRLLALEAGVAAEFGVRVGVPLRPARAKAAAADRTEVDLRLRELLVEAKLTEGSFQAAPERLVLRYRDLHEVFLVEDLPRRADGAFAGYQLLRGALLAHAQEARFAVLVDSRRPELGEQWFAVLRAVRSAALRSRLAMVTWQELAGTLPRALQRFLAEKYGIVAA